MASGRRHPIRGLLSGLFFSLGLSLMLIVTSQIALGTLPPVVIVLVGTIGGLLWGLFAPVRSPAS